MGARPTFYRGVATGRLYSFLVGNTLPAVLADGYGSPLVEGVYNGELVIQANRDGSVARGTAGPPDPANPYAPGAIFSPWEQAPQEAPSGPLTPTMLPLGLPVSLGAQ